MRHRTFDFIELISEDEARTVLEPHLNLFRKCIEDGVRAVEKMEDEHQEFFHVYPAGARATVVYWQIVHLAEERFQGLPGVITSHNRRFLTILIAEKLEIRFKKLGRNKLSRNYPTRAQKTYRLQLRLKGIEEPTRATAGYRLDRDGAVKDYLIVCERGQEIKWDIDLPIEAGATIAQPATEAPATETPKIRPKKAE